MTNLEGRMIILTKNEFSKELPELNKRRIYLQNITRYLDKEQLKSFKIKEVWVDDDGLRNNLPINKLLKYNKEYIKYWGETYILGDAWCIRKA